MLGLSLRPARREAVVLLLCAATLASQLFLPGFIGLADNGDFPKISNALCIGLADERAQVFDYFVSDYIRGPGLCWKSGLHSSAILPAWTASKLQLLAGDPKTFDIRWLGGVNAALFLVFFYVLLLAIRPLEGWRWAAASIAALWIFTDVSFTAYFNSFFTDSAALLGAMIACAAALWLLGAGEVRPAAIVVFACGALLLVTSKTQHAVFGFILAILPAALGWRAGKRAIRITARAAAACLLAGEAWMLAGMPQWYGGQTRFNVIFLKIATQSERPLEDLWELGLGAEDLKYAGMYAFAPGNPTGDGQWLASFCRRSGAGKLLAFYVRHPAVPLGLMREALIGEASFRRTTMLSNFRREEGRSARAQTGRFASWSRLRDGLYRKWPAHAVVWFGALTAGAVLVLLRSKQRYPRALAAAALGVAAIALGEFSISTLADVCETNRHLLLFHLFTDFSIFFALLWILDAAKWQARRDSNPRPPA